MKRDELKKKKTPEQNYWRFFILSFSYFSVCFLTLKLLCVKEEKKQL